MGYDEFGLLHENAAEADLPFDPAAHRPSSGCGSPTRRRATRSAPSCGGRPARAGAPARRRPERPHLGLHGPGARPAAGGHRPARATATRPGATTTTTGPQAMADDIAHVIDALGARGHHPRGHVARRPHRAGDARRSRRPRRAPRARRHHAGRRPGQGRRRSSPSSTGPRSSRASTPSSSAPWPSTRRGRGRRWPAGCATTPTSAPDGVWSWRYDRPGAVRLGDLPDRYGNLWDAISDLEHPILLVQGGLSGVVDDDDIAELQRRRPDARGRGGRGSGPQRAG